MRLRSLLLAVLFVVLLAVPASAQAPARNFDSPQSHDPQQQLEPQGGTPNAQRQDTPNDPNYDQAESDDEDKGQPGHTSSNNLYDERYDLFGFPSQYNGPNATYKDPEDTKRFLKSQVSGFNAAGAWKVTRGDRSVAVAILDTGIKWDNRGLRLQVRLNKGELPVPAGSTNGYDKDGNGEFNVDDYKDDPAVKAQVARPQSERDGPVGLVTGQDVIRAFSNGDDHDGNGFKDDIAGWDFFNDDNDPFDQSSYFAASNHGTGRTEETVERGNDNEGSIGICPKCQFVPVRVWDTFVSDGDTFGLGIFYATRLGVKVIEGSDGNLYHSAFTEAATKYAYDRGITQTYSGDDLNTANHNYPANYNHTMLIEGTAADTKGLGSNTSELKFFPGVDPATPSNAPPSTYFRGANTTQFGGKSSIAMEGATGSVNTGKASGAAALVISAAKAKGIDLSADETREILEQTAEDVLPLNTTGIGVPDPAAKGWDSHFGWGRADVGAAVAVADSGKIPPEASVASPDWYAPVSGTAVHITGRARAPRNPDKSFAYKVEVCKTFQSPGINDAGCTTTKTGTGAPGQTITDLGTVDADQFLNDVHGPDTGGPTFQAGGPDPFKGQFTVRLTVTVDGVPTPGVDRKVLTAVKDPTLRRGYPKRMSTGGEAPIRYADLNGDNKQELIVPLEDGTLHAYEPDGSELAGWPVKTPVLEQASDHSQAFAAAGLPAPREPLRGAIVADVTGDGRPEVIDTAGTHMYAWNAKGEPLRGFPVAIDHSLCRGQDQKQPLKHRKCGFLASPSLAHLEGRGKPVDIVAAALDGHVYAFRPDGTTVPGYPVDLVDPLVPNEKKVFAESINNIAVGDLNGDGHDDLVVASNETYQAGTPDQQDLSGGFNQAFSEALAQAAGGESRVYAIDGASAKFRAGWPIKLPGVIQNVLPLIGPGHDAALAKISGQQRVVVSTTGGPLSVFDVDGKLVRNMEQEDQPSGSTEKTPQLNLFEYASLGKLTPASANPAIVKYGVSLAQAANLLLVGQNAPYEHLIGAYDPSTGTALPGFPTVTDDYQFLSSSNVGKVAPGQTNQVLAGTGLGLLHAYDGSTGRDVSGFPKVTGGWLFAPPALSNDQRIADITREGYLFEWNVPSAPACQPEWPSFRHDDHQTGNYDADGTAPASPEAVKIAHLTGTRYRLTFRTPGDDAFCGKATAYETEVNGRPTDLKLGAPPEGGTSVSRDITLPDDRTSVLIRARDEAGNRGIPQTVRLAPLPLCADHAAPTVAIPRNGLYASRRRIAVRGSGRDLGCHGVAGKTRSRPGRVRRVLVAVARLEHSGCRFVDSRGHLGHTRSCRVSPHFLPARGTTRWSLRLSGRFPRGTYAARFRIYDYAGNVGRPQPRRFSAR